MGAHASGAVLPLHTDLGLSALGGRQDLAGVRQGGIARRRLGLHAFAPAHIGLGLRRERPSQRGPRGVEGLVDVGVLGPVGFLAVAAQAGVAHAHPGLPVRGQTHVVLHRELRGVFPAVRARVVHLRGGNRRLVRGCQHVECAHIVVGLRFERRAIQRAQETEAHVVLNAREVEAAFELRQQ